MEKQLRAIRSWVRREGRLTEGQENALRNLWPTLGITASDQPINAEKLFGRKAPLILEIGFGNGLSLAAMAKAHPENDYIGAEVYLPGVGSLLHRIQAAELTNLRLFHGDATDFLQQQIPDQSLHAVYLFFPDPWPKRKHHKRRILQPSFIHLLWKKLAPDGIFHMATDWEHYARHMLKVMDADSGYCNQAGAGHFSPRPEYRPLTKFEQRGVNLGHQVKDLIFVRKSPSSDSTEK